MSDEAGATAPEAVPAAEPAATPEQVATPATETQAAPDVKTEAEPAKTFTQAELDAIVQKEKAKAARIAESRAMKARIEALESRIPQQQQKPPEASNRPTRAQFADDDDYVEAMADWKLQQREAAMRQQAQQNQARTLAAKTENLYAEAQKIPGFDRDAFDSLPLTQPMAAALIDSDVPAKLMHYLATNPDEVARIASLPPARQAAAIGKLEDKVSAAPKTSNAPPPIKPIGSGGRGANTDRSSMSYAEYRALREKEGASWARR